MMKKISLLLVFILVIGVLYFIKHVNPIDLDNSQSSTISVDDPLTRCPRLFASSSPEDIDTNQINKDDWDTFTEENLAYTFKYPKKWVVKMDNIRGLNIGKDGYSIVISQLNSTTDNLNGGILVCDQDDYYSMKIGEAYISRAKKPQIMEIGHLSYFKLCSMSHVQNACDYTLNIAGGNYGISYYVEKDIILDQSMISILDEIVSTLQKRTE